MIVPICPNCNDMIYRWADWMPYAAVQTQYFWKLQCPSCKEPMLIKVVMTFEVEKIPTHQEANDEDSQS